MDLAQAAVGAKNLDPASSPGWFVDKNDPRRLVLKPIPVEIGYVTVEGLFLDGNCLAHARETDLSLALTYKPSVGLSGPVMRLDWNPLHSHNNKRQISGPWRIKDITGSHYHPFEDNYSRFGWDRMVKGNLPIAYPIDHNPANFRMLLDFAASFFNISDLQRIPEPGWADRLV